MIYLNEYFSSLIVFDSIDYLCYLNDYSTPVNTDTIGPEGHKVVQVVS